MSEAWSLYLYPMSTIPLCVASTVIVAYILFKLVRMGLSKRLEEAQNNIKFLNNWIDGLTSSHGNDLDELERREIENGEHLCTISTLKKSLTLHKNEITRLITEYVVLEKTINQLTNKVKQTEENRQRESAQAAGTKIELVNARLQTQEAKQQISNLQQTIHDLTEKLTNTEESLAKESNQLSGNIKMLINERQQSKEAKQALRKKITLANAQKDQLDGELTELKKTKLLAIQTALDGLTKRADTINNRIPKISRNSNRDDYATKFKKLKNDNDRIMSDLKTVTFTMRLYKSDHDALLKIQEEADRKYGDNFKKMQRITADCKRLISEYNSSIPDKFLKTIADHTRDLDILEKTNFNSDFTNEVAIQEKVLNCLANEREMLESILRVEKSNNLQAKGDKPNNLQYINNLSSSNTYEFMIYNMAEASDDLSDIISVQTFMHQATGKYIKCCGVDRFGVPKKTPRPAKITLKSLQDLEDVLNSKAEKEYSHIRVEKFVANKKNGKINNAA